jgi:Calx-beta domain
LAINSAGSIVGDGSSYLAGVGLRWDPPYGLPTPYFLSTISSLVAIDDQGVICVNGVEFDHGGSRDRYTAAVLSPGTTEIPALTNALFDAVVADTMYGGRVVGHCLTGDGIQRAFVWTVGAPAVVQLPDPAGLNVTQSEAESVNAGGDVVGYVQYLNAYQFGEAGTYLVLWKNANGVYVPYLLTDLFPLEERLAAFPQRTDSLRVRINDAGQVVMDYPWDSANRQIRVYQPVPDGIVQFSTSYYAAQETDGYVDATVTLFRADENSEPVTVHYQTSDADARAGINYVAQSGTVTWGPAESGDKTIRIPVIQTPAYEAFQSFNLVLTDVNNASFGNTTNAIMTIMDPYEMLQFANLDPMLGVYNVVQGETNAVLGLERVGGTDGMLVVTNLSTQDGSALAGTDYVGMSNTTSLVWQPGDGGARLFSVALLKGFSTGSPKTFYVNASGYLEDPTNGMFGWVAVNIVPTNQVPAPAFDESVPLLQAGSLNLRSFLAQGSTLVIESSTNLATWSPVAEITSSNGAVQFLAPVQPGAPDQFFRTRVK